MEKASIEMSLDEWELLPDNKSYNLGCFNHDGDTKQALVPPILPDPVGEETQDNGPSKEFKDIQEVVSQVFFKKMEENEFVDMKMESPKASSRVVMPQTDSDPVLYDEGEEEVCKAKEVVASSDEGIKIEEDCKGSEMKGEPSLGGIGFGIWRWRVTGIGALCSIGVAAATICIIVLSGKQRQKQQQQQHQKIKFQIYSDDKGIKQVVQQASRLNQAMAAVRGAPMTRAHITFGGYYDGI
ncbi:uncharacterized protein [Typha latifolia]|uniref:uncharacterized protein n=1 Tax=Typha latifolia TaxID=4733 RepID=UPI003C2E027A